MKCVKCEKETVGKSRYCYAHRKESRANFKAMIEGKAASRQENHSKFKLAYENAYADGLLAGQRAIPEPMTVQKHADPANDNSPVAKQWHVPEGLCGFAWVTIRPGNCPFANWLKKHNLAGKAYYGGVEIGIREFNQSVTRKSAMAEKMAEVLKVYFPELSIYAGNRLD